MNILFICSGGASCKSLIAQAILQSIAPDFQVYAAGIRPAHPINSAARKAMEEVNLPIDSQEMKPPTAFEGETIDYMITLGEQTKEEYHHLPFQYKNKLHLTFANPNRAERPFVNQQDAYRHLRDEMKNELNYFYHRILKGKAAQ
ncbi:arsenate reductase/protein-tyrosine-phosphatase family protein [Sunxiuqinia sp. sy24]|uniref:arsenate reductase/protein-tyrosine-phosphatase family protein n=1 Tax=Sunxiuqinia sp. sy24 TaxID=3461495 RepID=UPI00404660B0